MSYRRNHNFFAGFHKFLYLTLLHVAAKLNQGRNRFILTGTSQRQ